MKMNAFLKKKRFKKGQGQSTDEKDAWILI